MERKNYKVKKIKSDLKLNADGLSKEIWRKSNILNRFYQPWDNVEHKTTVFRALYDDIYLFMRFDVEEDIVFYPNRVNKKIDVANGERVEVFFRKDIKLAKYYCLEIDYKACLLDYSASYYRNFNYDWSWDKNHLKVKSVYDENKYTVYITISLDSLRNMDLLRGNVIEAGIYRGRCIKQLNTEKYIQWVTWVDPKTIMPDFHVPSSFGTFTLS